ncbi:AraC family transcriptional regulator [Pseudokineococcus marinus]|uniref:AraC family transcriptional regulator n=1 Tax=Pseudokineococcus marinus TaxID=351215 RepID=A0A849BSI7_9ACTN|nr:AraC family transcriptional regulator [Pseudokineococcus marinus]NNH22496.1 AraC family transcriptional regulator [Pseudokineococcus marinus]
MTSGAHHGPDADERGAVDDVAVPLPAPGRLPGGWPAEALAPALLDLLDETADVMFCAKDAGGRYTAVNDAFVRRTGERSRRDVVGRTARELFVPDLAERYEEQDAGVLRTGEPLRHELELIRREGGAPGWYLTTKLPVRGADGDVLGLVSLSQDLREADDADPALTGLSRVVELVQASVAAPPRTSDLAAAAGCSVPVLERRVRRVFGLSPRQLVLRTRIDRAADLLTTTDTPLADVAAACGFYDQPSFTRQFARLAGETPGQFRRRGR